MKTIKNLLEELKESGKLTIFEIPVVNIETKEADYIICNIGADDTRFFATRVGITKEENESKYVSATIVYIDNNKTLDYHLEGLYEAIIEEICNSEIYNLREDR